MVKERVQKILASVGVDSRRKCELLIEEGRVAVNGRRIKLGDQADSSVDEITVDGHKVDLKVKFVYLMFNKPTHYITTVSDMFERNTVMDLIPEKYVAMRVYPVGRLDRDAEGLLLLTNDGEFANRVMHPRYTINKTYRVWLDHPLDETSIRTIKNGMKLDDGWVKDMNLVKIDKDCYELTLHVGRHKIVKRVFDYLGYRVSRLIRVRIGNLNLGTLKSGQTMELTPQLLDKIFE